MPKLRLSQKSREIIASRAGYLCEYWQCPKFYIPCPFDIEHIIPLSLGGNNKISNLAFSCNGCNINKGIKMEALDPATGDIVPLFHPRVQDWKEHFAWDDSGLVMYGLTPAGRATVECLQLNREEVVNLRELLVMAGKHPPQEAI